MTANELRRDFRAAAEWFQRAAAKGLPDAQFALGYLYENGKGSLQRDTLFLPPLNGDWLCCASQADQAVLGQCIDGYFILTASAEVLKRYVRDHSDNEQVFPELDDGDGFRRVAKPGSAE